MAVALQARSRDLGERRFSEASKYVSRSWMPFQAPIVKAIKRNLNENRYSENPAALVNDLKQDLSLFGFCIRQLGTKVPTEARRADPLALLLALPGREIATLLGGPEDVTNTHDFVGMKEIQVLRLKHQLISCSTAEVIARKHGISQDSAFIAALLRQIGFSLVAWNYPTTCAKAGAAVSVDPAAPPGDFEAELRSLIGFDPVRLGAECLLSWNSNPALMIALAAPSAHKTDFDCPTDQRELGEAIRVACELGEDLARANDPTFYPRAAEKWPDIEARVAHYLGDSGVELIRTHLADNFAHYLGFAPHLLGGPLSPARYVDAANKKYAEQLLKANDHVRRCPEPVRVEFQGVYDTIRRDKVSVDALNALMGKVIPVTGFLRGCIYLLDNKRLMLVPRLRFGTGEQRNYRPVSCSCGTGHSHPVTEAYHCSMPIIEENVFVNGEIVSHITGKFGTAEKVGILHLEMSEELRDLPAHERLLYFKAIIQCLTDCLAVKLRSP